MSERGPASAARLALEGSSVSCQAVYTRSASANLKLITVHLHAACVLEDGQPEPGSKSTDAIAAVALLDGL